MARSIDVRVQERNAKLCADHKANPTRSYIELGRIHGMHHQNVYKALAKAGLIGQEMPKVKKPTPSEQKAMSNFHAILGVEVARYLNEENLTRQVIDRITETDIAISIGLSTKYFNQLKLGIYDPSLTQLMRIAEWMSIPMSELISTIEKKMKAYGKPRSSFG